MPEYSIDPVVMAASVVLRLQTIVSREVPAREAVVITIGSLQAGTMENVIPDEAVLKVNVRTYDDNIRQKVLAAIERIVKNEAAVSGAVVPPEITTINHFSIVRNDMNAVKRIAETFSEFFPADQVRESVPTSMSDDFGEFSLNYTIPSVYWFIGSTNPETFLRFKANNQLADLPTNHNSKFVPIVPDTLENGMQALVIGALAWLAENN
jgi:hippurate hydrolase